MTRRYTPITVGVALMLVAASCSDSDTSGNASDADRTDAVESIDSGSDASAVETTTRSDDTSSDRATTSDGATTSESTTTTDTTDDESELDLDERADDVREALSNGDFTTMLDLLELSGVADELEGREVTVLAPSEEAFRELSADELSELITDPSSAEDLLRRHIIDGLYTYDELAVLSEVTTISDETLQVTSAGDSVEIAGATVAEPDVDALSGEEGQEFAVFGIDRLLLEL